MAQNNHFHKFRRDSYSTGRKFYYCINGNCTFKCDVKHSLGKEVLCNECGLRFPMNEYSIRMAKPKCMNCVKRRSIKPELVVKGEPISDRALKVPFFNEEKDANNVDRISIPVNSRSEATKPNDTIKDLQEKMANLTIREYNPEDDL